MTLTFAYNDKEAEPYFTKSTSIGWDFDVEICQNIIVLLLFWQISTSKSQPLESRFYYTRYWFILRWQKCIFLWTLGPIQKIHISIYYLSSNGSWYYKTLYRNCHSSNVIGETVIEINILLVKIERLRGKCASVDYTHSCLFWSSLCGVCTYFIHERIQNMWWRTL